MELTKEERIVKLKEEIAARPILTGDEIRQGIFERRAMSRKIAIASKQKQLVRLNEKDIEQYLTKRVKDAGGLCYKLSADYQRGMPDRMVLFQGVMYFVEVKAPDGRTSEAQKLMHAKLRALGQKVVIVWSRNDVDEFIKLAQLSA